MLENTSEKFREDFLLDLIKEVIRNTTAYTDFRIKERIQKVTSIKEEIENIKKKEPTNAQKIEGQKPAKIRELISKKIKKESDKIFEMKKSGLLPELKKVSAIPFIPTNPPIRKIVREKRVIPPILRIPEPALPETVSYIKPVVTPERVDIGRLNILVNDPLVKVVECDGVDKNIIVMGMMGRKNTPIKLSKEEIDETVERFSEATKIPVNEGLFKAAVGNLVISAVISDIVGTQFVIRKITRDF